MCQLHVKGLSDLCRNIWLGNRQEGAVVSEADKLTLWKELHTMRSAVEFAERPFQGAEDAEVCVDMRSAYVVCDAADGGARAEAAGEVR